jgi:hypothetical protein
MTERVLPLVAVAVAAIGCSLLVNTDFTGGGTGASGAHQGGNSGSTVFESGGTLFGSGGTLGESGTSDGGQAAASSEGGVGNEGTVVGGAAGTGPSGGLGALGGTGGADNTGGTDQSAGGEAATGTGGDESTGGTSGGIGGSSGSGAGGTDMGGLGGLAGTSAGGRGGRGGRGAGGRGGGMGGMSGSGVAGNANCPGADLTTDPSNCGSCGNVCTSSQECDDSLCISSPCDGICATWLTPDDNGDGPRKDPLNTTDDVCVEVDDYEPSPGYLPAFNCWNVAAPRTMQVNGATMTCDSTSRVLTVPKRKGGYCVHTTAGDYAWAGFVMPYAAGACCMTPP